ncbi:hypothetical protein CUR178_01126 [Leishmania enriettii]|uniref:Mitochondrial import inner membrane translocase subunit TIM50 n=1 Tax=Leishmania enriettii TaxID=5663 RepID=A0A836KJ27_LEIEN|nr:hypothetical protein CUR178_01126 [Leishmania enriettii]
MSACSSIAVTGQCRSCSCAAVPAMRVRPPLARTSILGGTGNAYTSVNVCTLREVAAPSPGCALPRACQPRCPVHDATVPRQGKDAGRAQIIDNNDSSMSTTAYSALPGQRSCSSRGFSSANRRSCLLALPPAPGAVSFGSDRNNSASIKEALAETLATLPPLSPTRVKAVEESAGGVHLGAPLTIIAADLSPMPLRALHLQRRLSNPLRCGRWSGSNSDSCLFPPPKVPSLYAAEEELPVCIDPEGVRCCPLLDFEFEEGVLADDKINLSPFFNWKFVPYLPPQAECRTRPTVVLDMDETLLHTSVEPMPDADAEVDVLPSPDDTRGAATAAASGRYKLFVKYRPHLQQFLLFCLEHFEVVIFTASKAFYAHAILRKLQEDFPGIVFRLDSDASGSAVASQRAGAGDVGRVIEVLHRDHCTPTNVGYTKDLHLIGRDLRRTILVDNNKVCGIFQPYNTVHVKDFARRRCGGKATGQQQMREAQLRRLRGMIPASPGIASEDATASPMLSVAECSTSEYDWEDPEDAVLLRLCATGGLLHCLSYCESVPSFMQRTLRFNRTGC